MSPVPAIHVAVALGAAPLLLSVINRVKARFAGRRGQPLAQPYYDLAKLLRKEAIYGDGTTWAFRLAPVVGLAAVFTALLLVPFGGADALVAFPGDLVLFVYLLALQRAVTILAALDTGSSFEGMGASREAGFGALTEPSLLLALAALVLQSGGVSLSTALHPPAMGVTAPLVLGALVVVFIAENARIPVDDPNTHLELTMVHEVMVLDHGGPDLAFIHYASALKMWVLGALLVGVAVPQPDGWPWPGGFVLALAGMVVVAVTAGLVESVLARLRMRAVPQFLLSGSVLAAVALVLEIP